MMYRTVFRTLWERERVGMIWENGTEICIISYVKRIASPGLMYDTDIHWIIEKAREFQKNIYFCFIVYAKAFDCVDHSKLWKILQEMTFKPA